MSIGCTCTTHRRPFTSCKPCVAELRATLEKGPTPERYDALAEDGEKACAMYGCPFRVSYVRMQDGQRVETCRAHRRYVRIVSATEWAMHRGRCDSLWIIAVAATVVIWQYTVIVSRPFTDASIAPFFELVKRSMWMRKHALVALENLGEPQAAAMLAHYHPWTGGPWDVVISYEDTGG